MTRPVACPALSPRRLHLIRLAALGNTNAAIAELLGITSHTVASEIRQARIALGARDRTHAVALCMARGLITPDDITGLSARPSPERLSGGALCGLPHYRYPQSTCTKPAGHDTPPRPGPHAAPLIIDGRECGAVAWDADTNTREEPA